MQLKYVAMLAAILLLQACAHDRRSLGSVVDDTAIRLKAQAFATSTREFRDNAHVNIASVNGIVLLTGEVASPELRDRILAELRQTTSVRRIVNEIRIAPPSPIGERTRDSWLTTKVKSKLLMTKNIKAGNIEVVTGNGSVYLLGLVTEQEGDIATEAARRVKGVERVVKLFEFVD